MPRYTLTKEDEYTAMRIGLQVVESLSANAKTRTSLLHSITVAIDDLAFLTDFNDIISDVTGSALDLPASAQEADMFDPNRNLAMFIMVGFYVMTAIRRIVMSTSYDLNLPARGPITLYSLHMYGSQGKQMVPGLEDLPGAYGPPDVPGTDYPGTPRPVE